MAGPQAMSTLLSLFLSFGNLVNHCAINLPNTNDGLSQFEPYSKLGLKCSLNTELFSALPLKLLLSIDLVLNSIQLNNLLFCEENSNLV